jgi:serine/threonine-protein kinase HipA
VTDLPVYYEDKLVGVVTNGDIGPSFAYSAAWLVSKMAFPLSVRMPLTDAVVPPDVLLTWLVNLLPEGEPLAVIGRNLGISAGDVIGIVEAIGADTAGALSFGRPEIPTDAHYRSVTEKELERIINELPAKPFLAGDDGVAMSLAGAQHKLPVGLHKGAICIPLDGAPSTHILKPDNPRLPGSVQNEALCMVLARKAGLPAAEVTTGRSGDRSYLLVTRYDRQTGLVTRSDQKVLGSLPRRLHQEDFCQALGRLPSAKYERTQTGRRGPGIKDFFGLVTERGSLRDSLRLLDAVIFNVLIANVDSHAKNYSLLLTGEKKASMAPLYDLMCGAVWTSITEKMAQEIGGKDKGRYVCARHWRRMAEDSGLNATQTVKRVRALAEKVLAAVDVAAADVSEMPAGPGDGWLGDAAAEIRQRCRTVLANLTEDAAADAGRAPDGGGGLGMDEMA